MRRIESAKLAPASGKNITVLSSWFEVVTSFYSIADVVDDLMHVVEIKAKDDDLGMFEAMRKTSRVCELRSGFSLRPKDLRDRPSMTFDVGKKLLVGWRESLTIPNVAGHASQRNTDAWPRLAIA